MLTRPGTGFFDGRRSHIFGWADKRAPGGDTETARPGLCIAAPFFRHRVCDTIVAVRSV